MVKSIILIIVIVLAIIFSGCTGSKDVTSAFKAIPEVQKFLSEHPTAKITMTYWSKEEVEKSANDISQQCDKTITPVAMYKATVSEGDLKVVSWINVENQIVICSTTSGSILTSPKTTPATQGRDSPQISTSTPIQTPFSTKAPTVSVVASNNPDTQAISSNMVVEQVLGDRTTSIDPTIDDILIRIKTDADTTSLDLRQVIVKVMDTTIRTSLNYSNMASNLSYTAIAVRDEDGSFSLTTPVLNSGDLIEIQISSDAIQGISLAPRKTFWLSLNQELGQDVNLEIATPNSFGVNRYVPLYP